MIRAMQGEQAGDQWLAEWADPIGGTLTIQLRMNGHLVGMWELGVPAGVDVVLFVTVWAKASIAMLQRVREWSHGDLVLLKQRSELPANVVEFPGRRP
jgi:hypothetical protein